MAHLTVVIKDEVLRRARKRALDPGTSVNALLREYLHSCVGCENRATAMQLFVQRAGRVGVRTGRDWTRDQLHER
jgi:plasmid stability protein